MPVLPPKFLSLRSAAKRFSVAPSTVSRWIQQGAPFLQPGGSRRRVLIDESELEAWIRGEHERHHVEPHLATETPTTTSRTRSPHTQRQGKKRPTTKAKRKVGKARKRVGKRGGK